MGKQSGKAVWRSRPEQCGKAVSRSRVRKQSVEAIWGSSVKKQDGETGGEAVVKKQWRRGSGREAGWGNMVITSQTQWVQQPGAPVPPHPTKVATGMQVHDKEAA
jgi:hypothetical protein